MPDMMRGVVLTVESRRRDRHAVSQRFKLTTVSVKCKNRVLRGGLVAAESVCRFGLGHDEFETGCGCTRTTSRRRRSGASA